MFYVVTADHDPLSAGLLLPNLKIVMQVIVPDQDDNQRCNRKFPPVEQPVNNKKAVDDQEERVSYPKKPRNQNRAGLM
jgi:hypothetical protein